ncbi:MAG: asparagine synthase (glutamine-hydrolyzing) [Brumimicrobium sp.]|nr:asparagine synthase (glutamine-hydrolyzing) [Brumimicrobium sp.]
MCGISGIVSFNKPVVPQQIEDMTKALSHRGMDAEGIFYDDKGLCALGHRRLSIIDLSEQANQPMHLKESGLTIVYNGEIYNYPEIRKQLENKGVLFNTDSDTEVVLRAFEEWGEECVHRFNGMFAIAVWDIKRKTLTLLRDRIGIKPLYYFRNEEIFAFASEIKSLLPFISKEKINTEAVHGFFRFGFIAEPFTIYEEIKKFPKGHVFTLDKNGLKERPYWQLSDQVKTETISDLHKAKNLYRSLLEDSVGIRLRSDVPFGVFLSGGIDSSTVASVAQKLSVSRIKTFSIGFEESSFDESTWAERVARHLNTDHHQFTVSYKEAQELIETMPEWYDEPYADASAIPTYLVSALARKSVRMVLTGDGGDEQFLGYGMYNWARRLNDQRIQMARGIIEKMLYYSGSDRYRRASEYFRFERGQSLHSHIFSVDQYFFSEREYQIYFRSPQKFMVPEIPETTRNLSPAERQAFFDLHYYLPDDLLTKVDRATMQNGIEARVPLLDYRLVEFTLNLDQSLKIRGGETKFLLKEILYEHVPKELFQRPKWGFGIPLSKWLSMELRPLLDKYVNEQILEETGIYDVGAVLELKRSYLNGKEYLYNKLWLIMVYNMWFAKNKV